MLDKFLKDPHHLLPPTDSPPPDGGFVDLKKYKKTTVISPKCLWHNILTMVPGVSSAMANKIMESFPTLQSLMECRDVQQLSTIQLSTSRKLGKVIATRIMELMVTTTEEEISSVPEINNNVQHTETGVS
jgi:ERCC4-type nuclease